jgi:secreted Zn-dependent insulinase-like peptidase
MDIEIIQSPQDHRFYKHETLPNGLQVLIITDPLTKQSAAAMAVKVGMLDDPPNA